LSLDLGKLKRKLATPVLIDGRNAFDEENAKKIGFVYRGVGKGSRGSDSPRSKATKVSVD